MDKLERIKQGEKFLDIESKLIDINKKLQVLLEEVHREAKKGLE